MEGLGGHFDCMIEVAGACLGGGCQGLDGVGDGVLFLLMYCLFLTCCWEGLVLLLLSVCEQPCTCLSGL